MTGSKRGTLTMETMIMKITKRQPTIKKRNAQDLTLRNLRAAKRRILYLEAAIILFDKRHDELEERVSKLDDRLSAIEMPTPTDLHMRDIARGEHGE